MEYLIAGLILAVLFYMKSRTSVLKNEESTLVKKEQALSQEIDVLQKQTTELKNELKTGYNPDMTPEQIEDFWRNKK